MFFCFLPKFCDFFQFSTSRKTGYFNINPSVDRKLSMLYSDNMQNVHVIHLYSKASSRGAYGHDPFLSVFEEYPLDSTRSDITMTLSNNINSAVVISVVVESSRCSSKTLQKGSCPYAPLDEPLRYAL